MRPLPPVVAGFLVALCAGCGGGGGGGNDPSPGGGGDGGGDGGVTIDFGRPAPAGAGYVPGAAYTADAEVDGRVELFTCALDGSAYMKVSHALAPDDDVHELAWSPDGAHLAYLAGPSPVGPRELFVVAAGGGPVTRVSPPLGALQTVDDFRWAPSSARLAFRLLEAGDGVSTTGQEELWSVRPDGSGLVRLCPDLPDGRFVGAYAWSPDSARVAYTSDQDEAGVVRLHAVAAAGGASVEVSQGLAAGERVTWDEPVATIVPRDPFEWSPDSTRLAFLRRRLDDAIDLLVATADGATTVVLYDNDAGTDEVTAFAWAPDGSRVAYAATDQDTFSTGRIATVLPDGTDDQPFTSASDPLQTLHVTWAPDASRVAFATLPWGDGTFSGPATGGALVNLVDAVPPMGTPVTWSPDSSWVAFVDDFGELRSMPPDDFDPLALGVHQVGVLEFAWAPDASAVGYVGDAVVEAVHDALVALPHSFYGTVRVSPPLAVAQGVRGLAWSRDASKVVYTVDAAGYAVRELFASSADGTWIRRLSGPLAIEGQVLRFAIR